LEADAKRAEKVVNEGAPAVMTFLSGLVTERQTTPRFIRCDNGPELTANALRDWCRFTGAGTSYIEPGSPWQNPYVESFGSRLRDELLAVEAFSSLLEAQVLVEDWRIEYNTLRPHSTLGYLTPTDYAKNWTANHPELS
jgi:putative transposase